MVLSEYGLIVDEEIMKLESHYANIKLNHYVIMPNHIHAIISVEKEAGRASPSPTLGNVVGGLKSGISRRCGFSIWQRSYHDHIIRDETEYRRIWQYIDENPAQWAEDDYFI